VNGHVTFVAPRVGGQIVRVLVDDNNRVRKGQLLAQLDKEPYQIAVSRKEAAVDTAKADLQEAKAAARGIEANASSRRWALQHAVENVDKRDRAFVCPGRRARQEQGGVDAGAS
jgi:membrane fusion protein, multidrug efflux system